MALRAVNAAGGRLPGRGLARWPVPLRAVISGGQTGVDRAAQHAARSLGLDIGGWCPRGRRAEDGTIPALYAQRPAMLAARGVRTALNVAASDATLLLTPASPRRGSLLTLRLARGRQCCIAMCLRQRWRVAAVRHRLARHRVQALNIAGARASEAADIETTATAVPGRA